MRFRKRFRSSGRSGKYHGHHGKVRRGKRIRSYGSSRGGIRL